MTREEAKHIDAFKYWCKSNEENGVITLPKFLCENIVEILDDTNARPHGEWKEYNVSTFRGTDEFGEPKWGKGKKFICKRCLRVTVIRENFCPKCGASMSANDRQVTGKLEKEGTRMAYNRFIDVVHEKMATKYDSGVVDEYNGYIVAYAQKGAEETFSIGQPVYDEEGNLMGYLGIGMYNSLNYANDIEENTPVEHWTICLPTRFCVSGKKIYTYYQNCERKEGEAE